MKRIFLGLAAGVCLLGMWSLATGQPTPGEKKVPKEAASPSIQATRCRMTLFEDQPVACGRAGVLEFVGRQIETGKDADGKPIYKVEKFNEGQEVKEGEVIAQLIDDVAEAALRVAETEAESDVEVRYQEKARAVAEKTYEAAMLANRRVEKVFPEVEIQKLKLDMEKGVLGIEQAQHQLKIHRMKALEAAATLDTFKIRAPFDGIITHKLRSRGEGVREGDPIIEMANTKRVRVEGYVEPRFARQLQRGMRVLVRQEDDSGALETRAFEGRVLLVDVQLEKVTLKQRVVAEVSNDDNGLVAGRLATMTFVVDQAAAK